MDFAAYFPIWDKLSPDQQERVRSVSDFKKVEKDYFGWLFLSIGILLSFD